MRATLSRQSEEMLPLRQPILPPRGKPKLKPSTVYFPEDLWELVEAVVEVTKGEDPAGKGYNRNEALIHLVEWAGREFMAQRAESLKKTGKK